MARPPSLVLTEEDEEGFEAALHAAADSVRNAAARGESPFDADMPHAAAGFGAPWGGDAAARPPAVRFDDAALAGGHGGGAGGACPADPRITKSGSFEAADFKVTATGIQLRGGGGRRRPASAAAAVEEGDEGNGSDDDDEDHYGYGDASMASPASTVSSSRPSSGASSGRGCGDGFMRLSDLQPLESVGQGASGVVKRARHVPSGRVVALKRVTVSGGEKGKLKGMVGELQTLRDSDSPHIVSFHGAYMDQGALCMVMEYMDGGSLDDLVGGPSGCAPEPVLAAVAEQVLRGLDYLHTSLNTIHRDIKPSNVLLSRDGRVKLADFGVSGAVGASVDSKVSFVGTVTYMSPERIGGGSHRCDSDVWSLGLLLVKCALGYFPYLSARQQAQVKEGRRNMCFFDLHAKIVSEDAPRLPAADPRFSDRFRSFVEACLQKEPARRASAADLLRHPWVAARAPVDLAAWVRARADERERARREAAAAASQDDIMSLIGTAMPMRRSVSAPAQGNALAGLLGGGAPKPAAPSRSSSGIFPQGPPPQ